LFKAILRGEEDQSFLDFISSFVEIVDAQDLKGASPDLYIIDMSADIGRGLYLCHGIEQESPNANLLVLIDEYSAQKYSNRLRSCPFRGISRKLPRTILESAIWHVANGMDFYDPTLEQFRRT
jgi:DNA-binding NarL/FixJ family response regulator